jgi:hypothetical protein
MRDYTKVSPGLWHDPKFRALSTTDERLLYCYYKTGPHQNLTGCCHLPDGYACTDLTWTRKQCSDACAGLIAAGMILTDVNTDEVMICDWFGDNPPTSVKHLTGIRNRIQKIRSARLRGIVSDAVETAWAQRTVRPTDTVTDIADTSVGKQKYDLQSHLRHAKERFS